MFYIHKQEVELAYGGPEEGDWWYDQYYGLPLDEYKPWAPFNQSEDHLYSICRILNGCEQARRCLLAYNYTSVLADRETFYSYTFDERSEPFNSPEHRPHYE